MATCNAGHGCSITCPNGCYAIYNHSTGRCSKGCSGNFTLDEKEQYSIEISDFGADRVSEFAKENNFEFLAPKEFDPISLKMEEATGAEIMKTIRDRIG